MFTVGTAGKSSLWALKQSRETVKQESLGMSLSGVRLACHQTMTMGKESVWGEIRKTEDADLRWNEACKGSVCIRHYRGGRLAG